MPHIAITVESPIRRSFRVEQVAGLFDLPLAEKSRETFSAEVPGLDEPWRIGAIVGPSGSGKSSIARAAFGPQLSVPQAWPSDRALIDAIGPGAIKHIVGVLTAVGLGSPPTWVKPYHVLSTGERFRADLARSALARERRRAGRVRRIHVRRRPHGRSLRQCRDREVDRRRAASRGDW